MIFAALDLSFLENFLRLYWLCLCSIRCRIPQQISGQCRTTTTVALVFHTGLEDEHVNVNRSALQAERGHPPPRRRPRWRRLERNVERLKHEYATGHRSLADYWAAVTHVIHEFI